MERPIESQELLSILEACDPKWLAHAIFVRQQNDPVLERLCHIKVGVERGKQGDIEALSRGLEAAIDLPEPRRQSYLSDDFDLILTCSTDEFASLLELPGYEECIRPLLQQFVIRAAAASIAFEEGFGWWSALEDLCARLHLPVPESP